MADSFIKGLDEKIIWADADWIVFQPDAESSVAYRIKRSNLKIVFQSLFDANTILQATADNTPVAITIAEQRILGRITGGNITALTAAQIRTLLGLSTTDSPSFVAVNVTEVTNTAGIIKIQPDVQGDVELFGDTDVGDAVDGKSFFIRRKAAEGDDYLQLYINSFGDARMIASDEFFFRGFSNLNFQASGTVNMSFLPADHQTTFKGSTSGENFESRQYGWITAAAAQKYAFFKVDDTTDQFILDREDSNILGFKVNMPLDVAEIANSAGILKLNPDAEGNVELFGDTDIASGNGKRLFVRRQSVAGDDYLELFVSGQREAQIKSSKDMFFVAGETQYFTASSGKINLGWNPTGDITLLRNSTVGLNYNVQQYGYITAASGQKYISWQVDDTTDKFILDREDSNILGFKVNMPLEVTGTVDAPILDVGGTVSAADGLFKVMAGSGSIWFSVGESSGEVRFNTQGGRTKCAAGDLGARMNIGSLSASTKALAVRGVSAQTADILEVTDSTTAILFNVNPSGDVKIKGSITQSELSADPSDPAEGQSVTWQSDGTGSGDDGDIMMKITAGATTKTITLVDFSAS